MTIRENISLWWHKLWLVSKIRITWHKLWIRKDEFHNSLNIDIFAMLHMNQKKRDKYLIGLNKRRQIAHKEDMRRDDELIRKAMN